MKEWQKNAEDRLREIKLALHLRETSLRQRLRDRNEVKDHWQEKLATTAITPAQEAECRGFYWLAESQVHQIEDDLRFVQELMELVNDVRGYGTGICLTKLEEDRDVPDLEKANGQAEQTRDRKREESWLTAQKVHDVVSAPAKRLLRKCGYEEDIRL